MAIVGGALAGEFSRQITRDKENDIIEFTNVNNTMNTNTPHDLENAILKQASVIPFITVTCSSTHNTNKVVIYPVFTGIFHILKAYKRH